MSLSQVLYDVNLMKEGEDYKGAQKILEKFIEDNEESFAKIEFESGVVAQKLDQMEKAEQHFRKALELDPENLNAVANLGIVLSRKKESYDESKELFEVSKMKFSTTTGMN